MWCRDGRKTFLNRQASVNRPRRYPAVERQLEHCTDATALRLSGEDIPRQEGGTNEFLPNLNENPVSHKTVSASAKVLRVSVLESPLRIPPSPLPAQKAQSQIRTASGSRACLFTMIN